MYTITKLYENELGEIGIYEMSIEHFCDVDKIDEEFEKFQTKIKEKKDDKNLFDDGI